MRFLPYLQLLQSILSLCTGLISSQEHAQRADSSRSLRPQPFAAFSRSMHASRQPELNRIYEVKTRLVMIMVEGIPAGRCLSAILCGIISLSMGCRYSCTPETGSVLSLKATRHLLLMMITHESCIADCSVTDYDLKSHSKAGFPS